MAEQLRCHSRQHRSRSASSWISTASPSFKGASLSQSRLALTSELKHVAVARQGHRARVSGFYFWIANGRSQKYRFTKALGSELARPSRFAPAMRGKNSQKYGVSGPSARQRQLPRQSTAG